MKTVQLSFRPTYEQENTHQCQERNPNSRQNFHKKKTCKLIMSDGFDEELEEEIFELSGEDTSELPQKNLIVSVILSESTASLLELDIPNVEDLVAVNSNTPVYSLSPINASDTSEHNIFFGLIKQDASKKENEDLRVEVAYISNRNISSDTSLENYDDLCDDSDEDDTDDAHVDHSLLMEAMKVYTRPLFSANTLAHQDKIKIKENTIYVTVLDSELTITSSGWINFCRICHGGESIGNLIAPCRCKGSIALTHLQCLEQWLKQSDYSRCELCQHHYKVIRQPKYSVPWSVLVFLRHPGDHYKELLYDTFGFLVYTPTAIASTYLLMVLCDTIALKSNLQFNRNLSAHVTAFSAILGLATIDFTYSSWLIAMMQKHFEAWRQWYHSNCSLQIILPERKQRRHNRRKLKAEGLHVTTR